jgi:hypothetical protein
MPHRAGLDDNPEYLALLELWVDGQADLDSQILKVWRNIDRLLTSIDEGSRNRVRRLRLQVGRLEELRGVSERIIGDLTDGTARFINEGSFADIYAAGAARAGIPFSFTAPHRAALQVLATDLFDDVLTATSFIDGNSKDWVRRVGRQLTGFKLTDGTPVKAQARRFRNLLAPEFRRRGIGSIVYRDGSRHGFGEYAELLLRTKSAVAYNLGTLNQSRVAGIEFFELLDGSACGLVSHNDPQLANGLIVDRATAYAYPIAHPNCRRAVNPRPDLTSASQVGVTSVQSDEARADQTVFEEALRDQQQARARRRSRRARRPRPSRSPSR